MRGLRDGTRFVGVTSRSSSSSSRSCAFPILRFRVELNLFLMWLSVLPGKNLAISDHLFPNFLCNSTICKSSSRVHLFFLMSGFKWLCHLSRHYFPIRPGRCWATLLQFLAPCFPTNSARIRSSSSLQGPLIIDGLSTFCHLCKHCTSVLSWRNDAIRFQFFAPNLVTSSVSYWSSSAFQYLLVFWVPFTMLELDGRRLLSMTESFPTMWVLPTVCLASLVCLITFGPGSEFWGYFMIGVEMQELCF